MLDRHEKCRENSGHHQVSICLPHTSQRQGEPFLKGFQATRLPDKERQETLRNSKACLTYRPIMLDRYEKRRENSGHHHVSTYLPHVS